MRHLIIILLSVLSLRAGADTIDTLQTLKTQADSAYLSEQYDAAISGYEQVLASGKSAEVMYNLGNAYYRKGKMGRAILCYERTLRLDPGNSDALHNLDMAISNTADKVQAERPFFFVSVYRWLSTRLSVDGWGTLGVICFGLFCITFILVRFTDNERVQAVSQTGRWIALGVAVVANVLALTQHQNITDRTGAIIMNARVKVGNTPSDKASESFTLHEGTRIEITDTTITDWAGIRLSDGREGWVRTSSLERI